MFKEKVIVSSNDVDGNRELRLSSLFRIMQGVAGNHVDKHHVGHLDLAKTNAIWVVFRIDVRIYHTPTLNEELLVTTHAGKVRGFVFPRFFEIYDSKGKLIISSSSMWAIVDRTARRVVAKPDVYNVVKEESLPEDLPLPEGLSGSSLEEVDVRKVRYTEIDLNGH